MFYSIFIANVNLLVQNMQLSIRESSSITWFFGGGWGAEGGGDWFSYREVPIHQNYCIYIILSVGEASKVFHIFCPSLVSYERYSAFPFLEGKWIDRIDRRHHIVINWIELYVEPSLVRTSTSGADAPLSRNSMFSCK